MEKEENIKDQTAVLYEIGYLLNPLIAAEEVANEADKAFRTQIESLGGEVTSQLMPFMRPLAYAVSKSIGSKRDSYKDAYFGALRFELTADKIAAMKTAIDKCDLVLRYLLIRLPKNSDRIINFTYRKAAPRREILSDKPVEKVEEVVEKGEINEEQIDKEIEDLLVEQKVA